MKIQNKVFNKYNEIHGKYIETDLEIKQNWFNNLCSENYLSHLKNKKSKILEIGCGKGFILKWLKDNGFSNLSGIDLSPEDVKIAKKRTKIKSIYFADAFNYLKNKKRTYDIIISKDVLEHINKEKLEKFLLLINSSLKPTGKVIFQVPNMDWIMASHERYMDITHEVGFTKESLSQLLRLYFNKAEIHPVNYDFITSIKSFIAYKIIKPIHVKFTRYWLTFLGAGAGECLFEYREILGIGQKEK